MHWHYCPRSVQLKQYPSLSLFLHIYKKINAYILYTYYAALYSFMICQAQNPQDWSAGKLKLTCMKVTLKELYKVWTEIHTHIYTYMYVQSCHTHNYKPSVVSLHLWSLLDICYTRCIIMRSMTRLYEVFSFCIVLDGKFCSFASLVGGQVEPHPMCMCMHVYIHMYDVYASICMWC